MKFKCAAALSLIVSTGASAQSMNAEQFHSRAAALQKKGVLALFSGGEIKALTAEAKAAGRRAGEIRKAAVKASQAPRYCPPATVTMSDKEFMASLSAIPAEERARIDMTEAMTRILASKYPCKP